MHFGMEVSSPRPAAPLAVNNEVPEDPSDPGPQLRHGIALKLGKAPERLKVNLLDDVGTVQIPKMAE
jgi:hypothetical protein